jgi:SAM-dependent methyltransferase
LPSASPPLLWLRFDHEVRACPACASREIRLLDVFKIPRDAQGRRLTFLTGCHECGLLFVNPLPLAEELARQYAPDGAWAATRKTRAQQPAPVSPARDPRDVMLDALAAHVPVRGGAATGARVLDFGCGPGQFLDRLQDAGWETYGIEPSTDAPFARHRRLDRPPQDASFDFAILHHVLEHVTNPLEILRELAASLRQGGKLLIGIPALDTLPVHRDFKYCLDGRHHLLSYSETCLQGLLARAGMGRVVRIEGPHLDAITKGKPLRLRLLAERTRSAEPIADRPLAPAIRALRQYRRSTETLADRVRSTLPVRVRGALLDRAVERRARERRHAAA